ncbi:hypothetical protein P8H00_04935 [Brevundimonas diminuta]|nr:hypothetical protein [Brevundimonas diminuta]MDM8352234.1 hypothetical protein [Brevundimonas diminuta]
MQGDPHRCAPGFVDRLDIDSLDQVPDAFDQLPVRHFRAVGRFGQARLQLLDLAGVVLGRSRVQLDRRRAVRLELLQRGLQLGLLDLEGLQLLADDGGRRRAGQQGFGPALDGALDLGKPSRQGAATVFDLGGLLGPGGVIGADVGGDGLGGQKPRAQAVQHALLDFGAADVAVVVAGGRALFAIGGADQAALAERGVGGPAAAALGQAGQQARAAAQAGPL